ncbi:glycosyl hydrolase [Agromyces marinus]|uniref:glycosyl hydrolase n=1 Tax=Agromyces marinus TaxID=1389020 RepID=UPI002572E4BD|nr:glycosyl hydrolase [Agromyces marinus]
MRKAAVATAAALAATLLLAAPAQSNENTTIESDSLGNIFTNADDIEFAVQAPGAGWTIVDDQGRTVLTGEIGHDSSTIAPDIDEPGHYTLTVEGETPFTTTFALIAPWSGERDERFAINTKFGLPARGGAPMWDPDTKTYVGGTGSQSLDIAPILAQTGVAGIRDTLGWGQFEPEEGLYAGGPAFYDDYINTASELGAEPLVILSYGNKLYDQDDEGFGAAPFTERGIQAYAEYARAVLDRHEGVVDTVEVWNEYNGAEAPWNRGPCKADPKCYYEMLKVTAEVVHEAHPDAKIVGPAAVTLPYAWLEELFSHGALEYLDAVTVHPYGFPQSPEAGYTAPSLPGVGLEARIQQLDELIREYNDGEAKPIWFTEVGWQSNISARGVSEATQADYTVRSQVIALASGVERVYWYSLENTGVNRAAPGQNWGMVRSAADPAGAYTPKMAFNAYATLTRVLSGAEFDHRDETDPEIRSYEFRRADGTPAKVMWSTDGPRDVTLMSGSDVEVTRMDGASRTLTPFAGGVAVTLDGSPVYVEGEVESIRSGSFLSATAPESVPAGGVFEVAVSVDASDLSRAVPAFAEVERNSLQVVAPPRQERTATTTVDAGDGIVTTPFAGQPEERSRTVLVEVRVGSSLNGWLSTTSAVE